MNISFPDYHITLSDSTIYTIPSAIQLNDDGKTYLNYHPLHFNVLAASESTGSEIIRAASNIPVETWDQLQLFSSTLDAVYPLSINPLNNNISLNTTLDFEVVSNQLSIKNQGANCIAFFYNTGQSGIQCNPNLTYISTTLRAPNISTASLKTVDLTCTNSTFQNLLAFDSQIQSLTAGNINVPNITCSSIISNTADLNHITSISVLANNISTSYLVVTSGTIANLTDNTLNTTIITTNSLVSTNVSTTNLLVTGSIIKDITSTNISSSS